MNPKPKTLSKTTAFCLLFASLALAPTAAAGCDTTAPLQDRVPECIQLASDTAAGAIDTANSNAQSAIDTATGEANAAIDSVVATVNGAVDDAQTNANAAKESAAAALDGGAEVVKQKSIEAFDLAQTAYNLARSLPERALDFVDCAVFTGPPPCTL